MDTTLPSSERPVSIDGPRLPAVILFDVNETLSDMSPLASRFVDAGAPAHLAATWFAALLRDGFALTAAGSTPTFWTVRLRWQTPADAIRRAGGSAGDGAGQRARRVRRPAAARQRRPPPVAARG